MYILVETVYTKASVVEACIYNPDPENPYPDPDPHPGPGRQIFITAVFIFIGTIGNFEPDSRSDMSVSDHVIYDL